MGIRILWLFLCLGILSTGSGCYIVEPAPYEVRPSSRAYRRPYSEPDRLYCRGDQC
jgi:hypothetical protein